MSTYSKIESIELYNFMSFKKARLSFNDSGIINIKGFNDSGKSAIGRALAVCFTDAFKRKQTKFIHYGEDYFRVAVSFSDGVTIVRDKYLNGQSLYEMYKNDQCVFTTKQGKKLSKIDGVPQVIQDYLGLCVTDQVVFNYQSCTDRLPLVEYTGSENYQTLHEVLNMEEIFRANQLINVDKNALGREVSDLEVELSRTQVLYDRCSGVSQELIDVLSAKEEKAESDNTKKGTIEELADILEGFENIKDLPTMETIEVGRAKELSNLITEYERLASLKELPAVEGLNTSRYSKIKDCLDIANHLDSAVELPVVEPLNVTQLSKIKELMHLFSVVDVKDSPEIPSMDTERLSALMECVGVCKTYVGLLKESNSISKEIESVTSELDGLVSEAKANGISFVKCSNCGTYNAVGGEGNGV